MIPGLSPSLALSGNTLLRLRQRSSRELGAFGPKGRLRGGADAPRRAPLLDSATGSCSDCESWRTYLPMRKNVKEDDSIAGEADRGKEHRSGGNGLPGRERE